MRQKYFLATQNTLLAQSENDAAYFFILVKHIDINRLKKTSHFNKVFQHAVTQISVSDVFSKIAITAVKTGNIHTIKFLIEDCRFADLVKCTDEDKITLLHEACLYGQQEIILYLLANGANVNAEDSTGQTPLHRLAQIRENSFMIPLLCSKGALLDKRDKKGFVPLLTAAMFQNLAAIKELKKYGANVKLKIDNMDYLTILKNITSGKIIVNTPPLLNKICQKDLTEKAEAEMRFGFLSSRCNSQIFQDYTKFLLNSSEAISSHEALNLADAYFIANCDNINNVIKFLRRIDKQKKISPTDSITIALRLLYFFCQQNDSHAIEILCKEILTMLKQNTSDNIAVFYNELAGILNSVGSFVEAEKVATLGISKITVTNDNQLKAFLFYNFGMSKKNRMLFDESETYFEQAFKLLKDDTDILRAYLESFWCKGRYEEALEVCAASICGDYTKVALLHTRYLMGEVGPSESLEILLDTYNEKESNILALDIKSNCYQAMGDVHKSIEYAEKSYAISNDDDDIHRDQSYSLMKLLKKYVEHDLFDKGLEVINNLKPSYELKFSNNLLLQCFKAVIYLANQLTSEAELVINDLVKLNFDSGELSELYINLAINKFLSESKTALPLYYLELALKINPQNDCAKFYKFLLLKIDSDRQADEDIYQDFDDDFIDNIAVENNLVANANILPIKEGKQEEENDNLIMDDYDPIKIHLYFQNQKKLSLLNLSNSLMSSPDTRSKWIVNGVSYKENDPFLASLNSVFYPDHFAVIDPELKLDDKTRSQFQTALIKGYCSRRFEKNGIKILKGRVVELKIDSDSRLYTTRKYKNSEGKTLIIFDGEGNHQLIKKLLLAQKPIQIIELAQTHSLDSPPPLTNFFRPLRLENTSSMTSQQEVTSFVTKYQS